MIFSYDKFSRLEKPTVTLAKPNKTYIGFLPNYDLKTELYFNSISEATFTVYKYENGVKIKSYDEIEVLKLVEIKYIGWFQITQINKVGDGDSERKEITALSLENELCNVLLHAFGEMGTKSDEEGGQDMYCLYSLDDKEHSILHVLMEKIPTWTVGHIDPEIMTEYHYFTNDSVDAYSFLTGEVSEVFDCVFQFDTWDRTISAYKLDNIGSNTSIFLSYRNLINEIKVDEDSSNIKTIMNVIGGDYNGHPLVIADVNPTGTNDIIDVSYYRNNGWFSKELTEKYDEYDALLKSKNQEYIDELEKLKELIEIRDEISSRVPSDKDSMNWSEYGVVELQTQFDIYNDLMSTCLNGNREEDRIKYYNILHGANGIVEHQKNRQAEYEEADAKVITQNEYINTIVVNTVDFFGTSLYKELATYFRYTDYIDDTYVGKTNMTDIEILEMQQSLLASASKELARISKPSYTITVNSQNFPAMSKYIKYTEQLYLGNIATIEFEDDTIIEARLLKIVFDWEDYDNFELVFSSKTSLEDGWFEFAEVQQQASSSSVSQAISGAGWNDAKKQTGIVSEFMNNAFNAAKNKLFAGKNEEFKIDGTGTLWRKWVDEKNDYSPNQMWGTSNGLFLTDSAWASVDTAIGELNLGADEYGNDIIMYGIAAPLLLGKITITEQLYVLNDSGTYSMTKDGFIAQNANKTNKLVINPEDNEIFSIYKNSDKVVWFDNSGNAWFKGNITASEITGSKFTATNGTNTITIDPNNTEQLFNITNIKYGQNKPVLYFDSEGNGVFRGSLTVGSIFSQNWLTSGGDVDGIPQGTEGTFINLTDGTFFFGGTNLTLSDTFLQYRKYSSFTWGDIDYPTAPRYVKFDEGLIRLQYDDQGEITGDDYVNLYISPRGISTSSIASYTNNTNGIIEFYSNYLGGGTNRGITIRSYKRPVCLSSEENDIILNPNNNISLHPDMEGRQMFKISVSNYNNGLIRFGDFDNNYFPCGIRFVTKGSEVGVQISDGGEGLGNLKANDIILPGIGSLVDYLSNL